MDWSWRYHTGPALKIGTGAIIGSAAVVSKDVPDYCIAVGVSAKSDKKKIQRHIISKLLNRNGGHGIGLL